MTNAWLSDFYSAAHEAFVNAGLADSGTFTAQGAVAVPCKAFVDRDITTALLAGVEITKDQAMVRLLRDGISATPRENDLIVLNVLDASGTVVGVETFTVARRERIDEYSWVLVCRV